MYVTDITDYDGAGFEYDVNVTDGQHQLLCMATSKINIGCSNFRLISCFIKNIKKTDTKNMLISKLDGYYEYKIIGRVVDIDQKIVKVFGFNIEIDETFPREVRNGDFLEIICLRIDCQL